MSRPADHPAIPAPRIGVLLINLGTPDAPEARAVRRYLAEFLCDPRVVEIPRSPGSRSCTASSCAPGRGNRPSLPPGLDRGGLAARGHHRRQAQALRERLGAEVIVDHAMRYGKPAIAARDRRA